MLAKKCDRCGKLYEHYDIFNNTRRNGISIIHRDKFGNKDVWRTNPTYAQSV